ncbi:MAG: hypothetical protein IJ848_01355 [Alphaproteobacteria bacterium]|nr:hypothetical protein [Alphaproteobacteria bacterium]
MYKLNHEKNNNYNRYRQEFMRKISKLIYPDLDKIEQYKNVGNFIQFVLTILTDKELSIEFKLVSNVVERFNVNGGFNKIINIVKNNSTQEQSEI